MEYFNYKSEFIPDKLFAGSEIPFLTKSIKFEKGQGIIKRGTLIGKNSNGTFCIFNSDNITDIVPYGILADDINTSNEDIDATIYLSGIFNKSAVLVEEGIDILDYEYEFRKLSIYFKDVI